MNLDKLKYGIDYPRIFYKTCVYVVILAAVWFTMLYIG